MSNGDLNKLRYKRPKFVTQATTDPESSTSGVRHEVENRRTESLCPLLAKDSEWVDIVQNTVIPVPTPSEKTNEEVLQLVDCDDGPDAKPLALMFPALLERDPETLENMLNKAMSTTEVTRQLVDLGQKANFKFMKKVNRLIPQDKKWLESLTENSNSYCSESQSQIDGQSRHTENSYESIPNKESNREIFVNSNKGLTTENKKYDKLKK